MPSPFRGSLGNVFQAPTGLTARELAQLQRKFDSFVPDTLTEEEQVNTDICALYYACCCSSRFAQVVFQDFDSLCVDMSFACM
jgi:hypothetical protein